MSGQTTIIYQSHIALEYLLILRAHAALPVIAGPETGIAKLSLVSFSLREGSNLRLGKFTWTCGS